MATKPNNGLQADSGFTTPQPERLVCNHSGFPAILTLVPSAAETDVRRQSFGNLIRPRIPVSGAE